MIIETLSDHVGDLVAGGRVERRLAAEREKERLREQLILETELKAAARRKGRLRRWLSIPSSEERALLEQLEQARRLRDEAGAAEDRLRHRVAAQRAGSDGEDRAVRALSVLTDDWLAFRGYRNQRGETDLVLVGPTGLWAVEVKNVRARLYAEADRWWYEKLDRWGNVVETHPATDSRGRTWGQQVGEVADDLEAWLGRRGQSVSVGRAVVVVHDRASIAGTSRPGVDLVTHRTDDLVRMVSQGRPMLAASRRRSIATLIRKDHAFHAERRGRAR